MVQESYNHLIRRKEIILKISHLGKGTPKRYELRKAIAQLYGVPIEQVIVKNIFTEYGVPVSKAHVHVYDNPLRVKIFEPEYIIKRNEEGAGGQQAEG
ncbi:MAG: 30S ribosomal protein S24e [Desulfurococcaceae archaeon]